MPHTTTMQRRLTNVTAAIESRIWLETLYQSQDNDGNPVTIARQILPFKVYKSRDGQLVLDGFDTYRNSVRTFRLDRFKLLKRGHQHDGDDPSVLHTRGGEVTVYPAAWPLVQARPQTVSAKALDKFLASGWATQPYAGIIEPVQ
jgi:predicted DNA-binding transcriptional regulator YafY